MGFWRHKKVLVTGGNGFLGQHVCAKLNALSVKVIAPKSIEYDLTNPADAKKLFITVNPDIVLHLAARVGGIEYNKSRHAEQLYQNVAMLLNVMEGCKHFGVKKVVLVGSVCAYPGDAPIPFKEKDLMGTHPEKTVFGYGTAKRLFIPVAAAYSEQYKLNVALPVLANLYGPGDNFDPLSCHVIPAIIRKLNDAKTNKIPSVTFWGSGKATREFLFVEDAAEIILMSAEKDIGPCPFNVGSGEEIAIADLVSTIAQLIDYDGEIRWDTSKPDGHPRRYLDISAARKLFPEKNMINIIHGLRLTVEWFQQQNKI